MSLTNETTTFTSNAQILTIVGGTFTKRCSEGDEGAVARALTKGKNEGKEVWEQHYNALTAMIKSGKLDDGNFGLNGMLEMEDVDSGDTYTVQLPADGDVFRDFMKRLPNIDLYETVTLELVNHRSKTNKKGDPIKVLQVIQDGKRINDHFTEWKKDEAGKNVATNLHGMPSWENTRKGWNSEAQDEFLYGSFEKIFSGEGLPAEPLPVESDEPAGEALDDDGLPF